MNPFQQQVQRVIHQFGYKFYEPPHGVAVLDCRVLPNPFKPGLSHETLIHRVRMLPGFNDLVDEGLQLIAKHNELWCGCLYGRHRSGAVAQAIAAKCGARIYPC